jgi:hypothetical protein
MLSGSLPRRTTGIPVADEQRLQLLAADAGQERGVVDLVAVEVQDRQHRPVADRVEELVAVPARGEGAGFGLAVPDHGEGDQVRVVEDRPVGVGDAVAQLAALVDAAGGFGVQWLPMPPGNENCLKKRCSPARSSLLSG